MSFWRCLVISDGLFGVYLGKGNFFKEEIMLGIGKDWMSLEFGF